MSSVPSLRTLARQLDLAVSTVSEALRESPRVEPSTRHRVQQAAAAAGYRRNPVLGAAMSAARRRQRSAPSYRGTLAAIEVDDQGGRRLHPFHAAILAGAEARAAELGFKLELFWALRSQGGLSLPQLRRVFAARGIGGALVLPLHVPRDFSQFDFSGLSAVQMDECLLQPRLHAVLPDHFASLCSALRRVTMLGYRRVGLVLDRYKDRRLGFRWSAAFHAFFNGFDPAANPPPLRLPEVRRDPFLAWWREHRPDVILAHRQEVTDWLAADGARVPDDVGFLNLNWTERLAPCAGLDLQPKRLGATAIERVIDMALRGETSVPAAPQTVLLEARWTDGPTLPLAASRTTPARQIQEPLAPAIAS